MGIQLGDQSALILSGRKITALGLGKVTLSVAKGTADEPASVTISGMGQAGRRNPEGYLADLTQWRRMAIDRDLPPFPGPEPPTPRVEHGTLIMWAVEARRVA